MKPLTAKITKSLTNGTRLNCADNSGAKIYEIIGVKDYQGVRKRYPSAGVGDIAICSVKKGNPQKRKKVVKVLIVRQKKEYRRSDGTRIQFEDNAGVEIDPEKKIPIGTEIKGAIGREIVERYPKVAAIASIVI
ncbi:MAG: 50S ribosomal protein L14 [Candidatus Micrarchaeia archaeon]|jgi:large subunit ribosomal protein L14